MKRKFLRVLISVFLAVSLLLSGVSVSALSFKDSADLGLACISDIHYVSDENCGDYTKEFEEYALKNNKQYLMLQGLLESALAGVAAHAQTDGIKYLLIPGDLTMNGEYDNHVALAERLERFEEETGVQVIVASGNHDINRDKAETFKNNKAEPARSTTPEEFLTIYQNLGYDLADSCYTPPAGEKAGMLSYSVSLPEGYRLIIMDGGKYSADNTASGEDIAETAGHYTEGVMQWILSQIDAAKAAGETPIGATHWSIVPHSNFQGTMLQGFVIDNALEVSETLADAGMHYVFTGHSHSNDISSHISDNGEIIYDAQTSSLAEFPNYFREVFFTEINGEIKADYVINDVDCVLPVTDARGTTYAKPFRETASFTYTYKNDIADYVMNFLRPMIITLFGEIQDAGGIVQYLKLKDIDIEGILKGYIGEGLTVGEYSIFGTRNLMAFVNDLGAQIDERYINDPEYTLSLVKKSIDEFVNMKVSDIQCTKLEKFGYESKNDYGSLGDIVMCAMTSMISGDEYATDDFTADVLNSFRNGDLAEQVYNKLYKIIVDDLAQKEILANLYVNVGPFFKDTPYKNGGTYLQFVLDLTTTLFGSDKDAAQKFVEGLFNNVAENGIQQPLRKNLPLEKTSYLTLITTVLKALDATGTLKGGSIDGVIDALLSETLTPSQFDAFGETFADVFSDLSSDSDPMEFGDSNVTLKYTGKLPVDANADNYRLPSLVAVSLGDDSETTRNISWYTKYSVKNADIEIIPYSDSPVFTGRTAVPAGVNINVSSSAQTRSFPGVDLGFYGFLPYEVNLNRHIVNITGLTKGQTYLYRIGDAEKGWWSEVGTFTITDGGDETTFIHITDSQSQNAKQYENTKYLLHDAFSLYPDTDFIIHSGDAVDAGDNLNQWRYFLNGAADTLMSTAIMPVSGNHEAKGSYALDRNYALPTSVPQDTQTGYYYSYDYNNIHFIMLNTNLLDEDTGEIHGAQLDWLLSDAKGSDARWKIVVLHKAVYSNGPHCDDSDVTGLREQLSGLMPELCIDIVFQGHDHVYLRTAPMKDNAVVDTNTTSLSYKGLDYTAYQNTEGSIYTISGTAGVKFYGAKDLTVTDKLFPQAASVVTVSAPTFSAVRVDGDTLYFDAYTENGGSLSRIDSFAIVQNNVTYALGDVELNGSVAVSDAVALLRYTADMCSFTKKQLSYADYNQDGQISVADARAILRAAAGLKAY